MRAHFAAGLATLALAALVSDVRAQSDTSDPNKTIAENLLALPGTSALAGLLKTEAFLPLVKQLNGTDQYTVFAPSNSALASVDTTDPNLLTALVSYHVLGAQVKSTDLKAYQVNQTLLTDDKYTTLPSGEGQALVITSSNGNVNVTSGKPDDPAKVTQADLTANNGVVHVIDQLLNFPGPLSKVAPAIADISTFTQLVKGASGLVGALEESRGVTIFAPNNAALSGVDTSSLNATTLADILKFHVINGTVIYSPQIQDTTQVQTVQGGSIVANRSADNKVYIQNFEVVRPDILLENGVLHIINGVMMPNTAVKGSASATSDAARHSVVSAAFLLAAVPYLYLTL
ncbi:hypothetical protein IWQ60_009912 [Tieghemiomyces parasiticus]|uniref:FAS1 domain-containing protein n=1 Tax=Tieghemiomyces parasiticus TaxID=78921 RepID=A0A9W7ZT38_9FUNG|nr:hypothetical protein IWQ60_009912 [Tieghemiomyces parasiticus]